GRAGTGYRRLTGAELMAVGTFGILIIGAISATFWRMWGLIEKAGNKGEVAQRELAEHRIHTAETYVTKHGMAEQTLQIMKAIEGVGNRIDGLGARLDRLYEPKTASRRTST